MNVKNVVDNKNFWKTVKSFFDKSSSFEKNIFNSKIPNDDSENAGIFTALTSAGLKVPDALTHHNPKVKDPIFNAVSQYQNIIVSS